MSKRTELSNYILRFDGIIEVPASEIPELLLLGLTPSQFRVFEITEDVTEFNALSDDPIKKAENGEDVTLNMSWIVPEKYMQLDLSSYFRGKISSEDDATLARVENELQEVKKRGLENMFKTIIYVLDVFREKNILWGVGRGSSCASYLLFVCGLHLVDPIKYQIPYTEFFH